MFAAVEGEVIILGIRMEYYYSPHPAAKLVRGHLKTCILYQ